MTNRILIANAFALSMLNREAQVGTPTGYTPHTGDSIGQVARVPRPLYYPADFIDNCERMGLAIHSIVGHQDTAQVFSSILGRPVPYNRETIKLTHTDTLVVGQLIGPRLPEGTTTLPEDCTIEWWII